MDIDWSDYVIDVDYGMEAWIEHSVCKTSSYPDKAFYTMASAMEWVVEHNKYCPVV